MNNSNCCNGSQMRRTDMNYINSASCPPLPVNTVVAMAYVPFQLNTDVYPCDKALAQGTLFPILDKPFMMGCCR